MSFILDGISYIWSSPVIMGAILTVIILILSVHFVRQNKNCKVNSKKKRINNIDKNEKLDDSKNKLVYNDEIIDKNIENNDIIESFPHIYTFTQYVEIFSVVIISNLLLKIFY